MDSVDTQTPSPPAPTTTPPPKGEPEVLIGAEDFLGSDDRERIPFAGLLAAEPELVHEQRSRRDWEQKLDAYLRSPSV
jgi:hypothetical protein